MLVVDTCVHKNVLAGLVKIGNVGSYKNHMQKSTTKKTTIVFVSGGSVSFSRGDECDRTALDH
jgi:hypothetical protein